MFDLVVGDVIAWVSVIAGIVVAITGIALWLSERENNKTLRRQQATLEQQLAEAREAREQSKAVDVRILELTADGGGGSYVDFNLHLANYGRQQCRCDVIAHVAGEAVRCHPAILDLIPNTPPPLVRVAPKSRKGTRRVPIPASLRKHLLEQKMRTGRDGEDLVFGSSRARPFTPTHVGKLALAAWEGVNVERREEEQTELKPIGLHELRHSYVSLMHDAGFSLERIGDYVGHSSAYMTDAYRHLLEGHEAEAAERFEDYLTRAPPTPLLLRDVGVVSQALARG